LLPNRRTARSPEAAGIRRIQTRPTHLQRETHPRVCYNATDMERPFFSAHYLGLLFVLSIFGIASLAAQQPASTPRTGAAAAPQQGIYLVFPFENAGASPRMYWLVEGLEQLTIQRLSAAGQQVYSHAG